MPNPEPAHENSIEFSLPDCCKAAPRRPTDLWTADSNMTCYGQCAPLVQSLYTNVKYQVSMHCQLAPYGRNGVLTLREWDNLTEMYYDLIWKLYKLSLEHVGGPYENLPPRDAILNEMHRLCADLVRTVEKGVFQKVDIDFVARALCAKKIGDVQHIMSLSGARGHDSNYVCWWYNLGYSAARNGLNRAPTPSLLVCITALLEGGRWNVEVGKRHVEVYKIFRFANAVVRGYVQKSLVNEPIFEELGQELDSLHTFGRFSKRERNPYIRYPTRIFPTS